jgi:putative acetyltransferase
MATSSSLLIRDAASGADLIAARKLFEEYAESLGFSLCFQGFDREITNLPGDYRRPGGRLLLANVNGEPAGCVALRPLDSTTCEMKRLYVRPAHRAEGIGKLLVERLIHDAREVGYTRMRLDSLPSMRAALNLYRTLGFREIDPYTANPVDGAVFLELQLEFHSS